MTALETAEEEYLTDETEQEQEDKFVRPQTMRYQIVGSDQHPPEEVGEQSPRSC